MRRSTASCAAAPADPAFALRRAGTVLYTWDLPSDAIVWSPNAADALGRPDLPTSGRALLALIEPGGGSGPLDGVLPSSTGAVGDGASYRHRYALRIRPDRLLAVEDTGRWYPDAHGRPACLRGALRVERCGSEAPTAGLRARAALLDQLCDDVLQAGRLRRPVTLVAGQIEDVPEGADCDELMAAIALRLRPLMRRRDRFIPYPPNRFALALISCPLAEAGHALARLARLVCEPCLRLGAATAPDHARDAPELLRRAEDALSGQHGGGLVYEADPALPPGRPAGTAPEAIVDALNARGLVTAYRPVLDAQTRRPVFASLVPHLLGKGGAAAVGDLAAASCAAGIAAIVEARLVELAAEHLACRTAACVAIDVSAEALHDPDWTEALAAHLGARPGIASRLIAAVHESALAVPATRGRLDALKALGVGIMLRGFGGGHAGLRQLEALPLDILALEGALLQTLQRSTDDRLLVRSLVDLAQHLGIATLAEGVEDDASARLLAEWGVDYIAGPLAGGAVPSVEPGLPRQAFAAA